MPKIMFVEDEISSNITRLIDFFGQYLSATEKTALLDAENQMGADGEDIRKILVDNPVLEVYYSFKQVLMHIRSLTERELNQYDMFILDRNLTGGDGYNPQEIQQLDKGFDNSKYKTQEGDYLALQLHLKGCPIKEKVFFYTAYPTKSFGATEIEQMVDYGTFFNDNFFDKGRSAELIKLINDQQQRSLFAEHRDIFDFIKRAGLNIEEELMRILLEAQKTDARITIDLRTVIDSCLKYMTNFDQFWYEKPEPNTTIGVMIGKLDRGNERGAISPGRTPAHIRDFFDNINHIVNVYEAHKIYEMPSPYAVKALACQVLEIITWIKENCK